MLYKERIMRIMSNLKRLVFGALPRKCWTFQSRQVAAMTDMRDAFKKMALAVNALVPDGREKSLALTKLEEAMFHTNAGISRHGIKK